MKIMSLLPLFLLSLFVVHSVCDGEQSVDAGRAPQEADGYSTSSSTSIADAGRAPQEADGYSSPSSSSDSSPSTSTASLRIVGGNIVPPPNPYPWAVSLRFGCSTGGGSFLCAGSVIAPNVVLTAAHCWDFDCLAQGGQGIGVANTGLDSQAPDESLAVKQWIGHPDYQPQNFLNDIALWILDGEYQNVDTYAKLPSSNIAVDTSVIAAGWGKTAVDEGTSRQMRDVALEIQPPQGCATFPYEPESQICAGVDEPPPMDTCNGDSGGPLFTGDTVHGLTSFGSVDCGSLPGAVYSRVRFYDDWIRSTLSDEGIELGNDSSDTTVWIIVGVVLAVVLAAALVISCLVIKSRNAKNSVPTKPGSGAYQRQADQA